MTLHCIYSNIRSIFMVRLKEFQYHQYTFRITYIHVSYDNFDGTLIIIMYFLLPYIPSMARNIKTWRWTNNTRFDMGLTWNMGISWEKIATSFYSVLVPDAHFLLYNIPAYILLNIDLSYKGALLQNICRSMCTFKCRNCTQISSIDIDIVWIFVGITKQFPINIIYCFCLYWTNNLISF